MTEKTTISRRTVAKGIAWSVPAVAVSAAVPAYAASPICVTVTFTGSACKEPGNSNDTDPKAYNLGFVFKNTCATDCVTIVVTSVKDLYTTPALTSVYAPTAPSNTFQVCAGNTATFTLPTTYSSNSSNGIVISYTVNGAPGSTTLDSPPNCGTATTTSTTAVTSTTTTAGLNRAAADTTTTTVATNKRAAKTTTTTEAPTTTTSTTVSK